MHLYLCSVIGDGTSPDTAFRPSGCDNFPTYSVIDLRYDDTQPEGHMLLVTNIRNDALVPDGVYLGELGEPRFGVKPAFPEETPNKLHLKGELAVVDSKIREGIETRLGFTASSDDVGDVLKEYFVKFHPRFLPTTKLSFVINGVVLFHYDPILDGVATLSVPAGKSYRLSDENTSRVSLDAMPKTFLQVKGVVNLDG